MMKLKTLSLTALMTLALAAFNTGSASATTVEVGGVTQNKTVNLSMSLKWATSVKLTDTFGFSVNTCTGSSLGATTDAFSGSTTTAGVWTLAFTNCSNFIAVDRGGTLHIAHIFGTTNGTVTSSGAAITTDSPFGILTCQTGTGTHLGTLTGSASGHASLSINAVLSCSGISSRWTGTYTVTSPTGLGVVA